MTVVVTTRAELAAARDGLRAPVGLVPTLGALHDGHSALLTAARRGNAAVVASIFVNPLQFGPNEDFDRYPRPLAADIARSEAAGVDVIWTPSVDDMYPPGRTLPDRSAGSLGDILEGAERPGHFTGMLTVVAELLTAVHPDRAYFGEKDYQQLTLVRGLADQLDLGIEIVGVATVREADGLALSSRNVYLSAAERTRATALSRALIAGAAAAPNGPTAVIAAARTVLAEVGIEPDYLELRASDLGSTPEHGPARLLVAARVGSPRLIDNIALDLP
jgi:pantoate--beta-alanine ligase